MRPKVELKDLGLIDFKEAKHLWKTDKTDFIMFIVTAIATLLLGVEEGIAVGVVLSLIMVIYRVSYPHIAEIAKVEKNFKETIGNSHLIL